MKKLLVTEIFAALLMLLFLYAAVSKWMDYQKFQVELSQSPVLGPFANWLAWVVPTIEILITGLLARRNTRPAGFYGSFFLLVAFCAYIIAVTRFSPYTPCSCGGILENMGWTTHLYFNIVFVTLSLAGVLLTEWPDRSMLSGSGKVVT